VSIRKTPANLRIACRLLPLLLSGVMLAGCSESPDEMVKSAQTYLGQNDTNAAVIQLKNALQADANLPEARFLLGKIYFDRGEYANAVKELTRASELGMPDARLADMLARAMVQQGEAQSVLDRFSNVEMSDPKSQSQLLAALGDAGMRVQGKHAEESFRNALSLDPANGYASRGIAILEVNRGHIQKALEVLESAIASTPKDAASYSLKGMILLSQDQTDAGLDALRKVIELNPKEQSAYLVLATNLLRLGRLEETRKLVADLKSAAGQSAVYAYVAAALKMTEGDIPGARDLIQQVVRNAPDFIPGRFLAGVIFYRANDQLQAQTNLNHVIEANPKNWAARRMLAQSYIAQRDATRAIDELGPILKAVPDDPATLNLAGQAHIIAGDFDKASEYFEKAASKQPENSKTLTRLGISRLAAGELDQGLATLAEASQVDNKNAYADFARVTTLLKAGRINDALAAQAVLEKKLPNSPLSKNLRGGLMLATGDKAAAMSAFQEALKLDPNFLPAAKNAARLYAIEGRREDARALLADMAKRNPKRVDIQMARVGFEIAANASKDDVLRYFNDAINADSQAILPRLKLAEYRLVMGDAREALAVARDAQAQAPDNPVVLGILGKALLLTGSVEEAVGALQKRADKDRKNPQAFVDLAIAQLRAKERAAALRSFEAALDLDPQNLAANQGYLPLLIEGGKMEKALQRAKALQRSQPKLAYPYLGEAMIHQAQGDREAALTSVRKAYEVQPSSQVAISLYQLLDANGKAKEAVAFESDWIQKHPTDNLFKGFAAEMALQKGRFERADELYRDAAKTSPNDVKIINNLAWVAHKRKAKDALELAERAFALAPDNPAVLDTVGVIEVGAGQVDSGLKKLERAVELAPKAGQIRFNLANAYVSANRPKDAGLALDALIRDLPEDSALRKQAVELRKSL